MRSLVARGITVPAPALRSACFLLLGLLLTARLEVLPAPELALAALLAAIVASLFRVPGSRVMAWTIAGATLLAFDAELAVSDRLDPAYAGVDVKAKLRVVDFPKSGRVYRFLAEPVARADLPRRIRMSWYDADSQPKLGECWQITMRLRRPRGFANPARFDYERWLIQKRIGATGYVREARHIPDCPEAGALAEIRQRMLSRIQSALPQDDRSAVLVAITLGARQWIDDPAWTAFIATGTGHLMAISGMHVALAAGAIYLLSRFLFVLLAVGGNHRQRAAIVSLAFACVYVALSGLAVPSRRAALMLAIGVLLTLSRRRTSAWQVFGLAVILVTAAAPLDALSPGFMLSFAAVGLLIRQAATSPTARRTGTGAMGSAVHMASGFGILQLTLLFGLLPLTAGLFGRVSVIAPLANLLVLPLFNFVVLPAALSGVAVPGDIGDLLLLVAWHAVGRVLDVINWLSSLPMADIRIARLGAFGTASAWVAALATLLPPGWPLRSLRWLALGLLLARPGERPPTGCLDLDVLDVGQGLATVVRTRNFTLLYDAGPAFRSGGDTGRLVLAPFLDYIGIREVDMLVLSHDDLDHTGGLRSIAQLPPVSAVLRGEPSRFGDAAPPGIRCEAGQVWFRDGIRFVVLSPRVASVAKGNNASCVLEMSVGGSKVLLTGDIESSVERSLLSRGFLSPVDAVIVPHHGSKTSSHPAFVERLAPEIAVASAGFENRWGMPRPEVIERWQAGGAAFYSTGTEGAVGLRLCLDKKPRLRYRQRKDHRRFWHSY